jgi:hypothetical protein
LRKTTISFIISVCPSVWNNSAPTRWIFMKFNTWLFFKNLWRKFKFHKNLTRITGTSHGGQYTYLITSWSVLLRIGYVSDKSYRENQSTHFMRNNFFLKKSCCLSVNVEEYCCASQAIYDNMMHVPCMLDT